LEPLNLKSKFDGLNIEELSVLDLGCGIYNTPISVQMLRLPFKKLESIDRHGPIVKQLHSSLIRGKSFLAKEHVARIRDARTHVALAEDNSYDVILMLDFLEHIEKGDGAKLLEECKRVASKRVLLWIPLESYESEERGGNPYQVHLAAWTKEELEDHGYTVTVFKDFHQHYDPPVSAAWAIWDNIPVESILVERLDVHGDVLVATSILPGLKKKYPDAEISWHVRKHYDFALLNNPYIDKIIQGPDRSISKEDYDLAIAPDHHMQWNRPMAQIHCDDAGVPFHRPELYLSKEEIEAVPEHHRDRVLVANKAGWKTRMCPNLNDALMEVSEYPGFVQIDNGPDLYEGIDHPNLTLRGAAAYMYWARLYIGIDTVFMHMAVAFDKPMVLCMGPTGPESQYIPNATVIKPYEWDNPAKPYPDKHIELPVENIVRAIKTKLNDDMTIADRRTRLKFVEYTDA